jgi:hypothetical protein
LKEMVVVVVVVVAVEVVHLMEEEVEAMYLYQ